MLCLIKKFGYLFDRQQKIKIILILIMMILGAMMEALGVGLMLPLVSAFMDPNIVETNQFIHEVCSLLGITSQRTFLIVCFIALIFVFVVKNVYLIFEYYYQSRFIHNNKLATQRRVLNIYLNRPYEFFLNAESGEILRVIDKDIGNSYNLLMVTLTIVAEGIISTVLVITVLIINPFMTIATATVLGLTMLVIIKILKPILRREGMKRQKAGQQNYKWLLQSINGIKEIKISQSENFFKRKFEDSGQILVAAERTSTIFGSIPRMLIEMICMTTILLIVLLMVLGGNAIADLVPALSAFAMAAVKIMPSANKITSGVNQIAFLESALDNLLVDLKSISSEYGDLEKDIVDTESVERKSSYTKEIALSNIEYYYPGMEKPVLQDANMSIPIGCSVGIVGASGAGKTTAVDILLGLLEPQKGQVLCDGVDVKEDYSEWLSHVGYIPQMIFMLDDTIRANVAFGKRGDCADDKEVWEAIEKAQLGDFVRSLPSGLDTEIGEGGVRISGGQRQRIGIARALYSNPEILVFDEATSALDNETESAIMESINALHGHKTIIIIAHRLTTIEECDIVYRVEEGKIIKEKDRFQ